jgi:nucleotide-binding universal stress UspA family protein
MYQTILLAYDGTLEGRTALREGALLARRCGARVVLLAVVETEAFVPVAADAGIAYVPRDQTDDVRKVLEEGAERLTLMGLAHSTLLRTGDPASCIATAAAEVRADLVVIGHRPLGMLARWLHGSVTASLIDRLDCSLLTARLEISEDALFAP